MSLIREIRTRTGIEEVSLTPKKAVVYFCRECLGWDEKTVNCGGEGITDGESQCLFHPFRQGQGRPSVKAIRNECLHCCGKSSDTVKNCHDQRCPLHPYRLGTNPERQGMGGTVANFEPQTPALSRVIRRQV